MDAYRGGAVCCFDATTRNEAAFASVTSFRVPSSPTGFRALRLALIRSPLVPKEKSHYDFFSKSSLGELHRFW